MKAIGRIYINSNYERKDVNIIVLVHYFKYKINNEYNNKSKNKNCYKSKKVISSKTNKI